MYTPQGEFRTLFLIAKSWSKRKGISRPAINFSDRIYPVCSAKKFKPEPLQKFANQAEFKKTQHKIELKHRTVLPLGQKTAQPDRMTLFEKPFNLSQRHKHPNKRLSATTISKETTLQTLKTKPKQANRASSYAMKRQELHPTAQTKNSTWKESHKTANIEKRHDVTKDNRKLSATN